MALPAPGAIRVLHVRTVRGNGGGPEKTVFRSAGYFQQLGVAAQALHAFRAAYRQAWALFKQRASAVFPGGTLLMRKRFAVPCDPLDAACWCQLAVT